MGYSQSEKINGRAAVAGIINSICYESVIDGVANAATIATHAIHTGLKSECVNARREICKGNKLSVQAGVIVGLLLAAETGEFGDIWETE